MGISKQSIEDLKNKSKISDFILSSTTGKLRGNKGMALCPFHGEKTASMSFTDEENLFHCFGCKEGGDMFKYIQLINNVEFQESVEIAADKYSFNLTYTDSKFETNQKNLIDQIKKISDFFIRNMNEVPVYVVANIVIQDPDTYKKYEKGFFPILKKYEGKFITFDDNIGQLEGSSEVSGRVIIFSFPNENLADQWYSSVEYQELSAFRREGTDTISIFKVKGQPPRN